MLSVSVSRLYLKTRLANKRTGIPENTGGWPLFIKLPRSTREKRASKYSSKRGAWMMEVVFRLGSRLFFFAFGRGSPDSHCRMSVATLLVLSGGRWVSFVVENGPFDKSFSFFSRQWVWAMECGDGFKVCLLFPTLIRSYYGSGWIGRPRVTIGRLWDSDQDLRRVVCTRN